MSQPMSGSEIKAAYAAGRRDFRCVDLRGTELRKAELAGVVLGPRQAWQIGRGAMKFLFGAVCGFLASGTWLQGLKLIQHDIGIFGALLYAIITLLVPIVQLKKGVMFLFIISFSLISSILSTDGIIGAALSAGALASVVCVIATSAGWFWFLLSFAFSFLFPLSFMLMIYLLPHEISSN